MNVASLFFFTDKATTEVYPYCHTLSLHDALPIDSNANTIHCVAGAIDGISSLTAPVPPAARPSHNRNTPGTSASAASNINASAHQNQFSPTRSMAYSGLMNGLEIGRAHV